MASQDMDEATAALIARLMAEDQDYYDISLASAHSYAIGGSYHDYEDPITSYERQIENGEQAFAGEGWGSSADESSGHETCTTPPTPCLEPIEAGLDRPSTLNLASNATLPAANTWDSAGADWTEHEEAWNASISQVEGAFGDDITSTIPEHISPTECNTVNGSFSANSIPAGPSVFNGVVDPVSGDDSIRPSTQNKGKGKQRARDLEEGEVEMDNHQFINDSDEENIEFENVEELQPTHDTKRRRNNISTLPLRPPPPSCNKINRWPTLDPTTSTSEDLLPSSTHLETSSSRCGDDEDDDDDDDDDDTNRVPESNKPTRFPPITHHTPSFSSDWIDVPSNHADYEIDSRFPNSRRVFDPLTGESSPHFSVPWSCCARSMGLYCCSPEDGEDDGGVDFVEIFLPEGEGEGEGGMDWKGEVREMEVRMGREEEVQEELEEGEVS